LLPPVRPAVLLVDDDLTLLSVLSRRVSRAGYEVATANSGPAALKLLEGEFREGDVIRVDAVDGELRFEREQERVAAAA